MQNLIGIAFIILMAYLIVFVVIDTVRFYRDKDVFGDYRYRKK